MTWNNMKYVLILLCFVLLLLSCTKPKQHKNEIIKVELARSGAWSDYGGTISIDTSLNYKYYGDYGNIKQGYFTGKISGKFWDTLNRKLEQIRYKKLPASDNANVVDVNYFELINPLEGWETTCIKGLELAVWLCFKGYKMDRYQL